MATGMLRRLLVPSCRLLSHHTPAFPSMGLALPPCSLPTGAGRGSSGEPLMTAGRRKAHQSFPLNCLLSL